MRRRCSPRNAKLFVFLLACLVGAHCASAQVITTVAGTDFTFPNSPLPALNAPLGAVTGVAVDANGDVYAADPSNNLVMRFVPGGQMTVVAGNGTSGYSGDGGPATSASLQGPNSVAVDSAGNLYIADSGNDLIRKVSNGTITTVAGNGSFGFSGDGGAATSASLNLRLGGGVAVDLTGNLYIADTQNSRIRKVSNGTIMTVVGNGKEGFSGDGGPATSASLFFPAGLTADSAGNLYVADTFNNRIRKISGGIIATVAGGGSYQFSGDGGPATSASLDLPGGVVVDASGNLYIADTGNNRIRQVTNNTIMTIDGNGSAGFSGDGGPAITASLHGPSGVSLDLAGNFYIADTGNQRIRQVAGRTITTVAGNDGYRFSGDGGPATSASLNGPRGVAADAAGNLYIADWLNNRIRKVSGQTITTFAGNGIDAFSGDGGPATSASLDAPVGVAVDSAGNVYFSDGATRIRIVSGGTITTIAGNGNLGSSGDGGPATSASLDGAFGLAVDAAGNLYIADQGSQRIRMVSGGTITTVAGNGISGFSGDGGPATSASLSDPGGVAVDSNGNLYIADLGNSRIRKVSGGTITTVAGNGTIGFSGDGGPATSASLNEPEVVAVDSAGNIYITDYANQRIRKVSGGVITTVVGNGNVGFAGDGGPATSASLDEPWGAAADSAGNVYIADGGHNRIRAVLVDAPLFTVSSPVSGISLSASSGGNPSTATLTVSTTIAASNSVGVPGMAYFAQVNGAPWLSVSPQSGQTPGLITVTADPSSLVPGFYSGAVTLSVPNANPPTMTVSVQFTVGARIAPSLSVDHNHLSFTYSNTSAARTQTITLSNAGGGSLPFSASIALNLGQPASWLSVLPTSGAATPATPAVLSVTANPSGLSPGTYSANIVINSAAGSATVSVVMTISGNPLIVLLSQTGLTFTAVQNGGAVPTQTFSVLNLGSGTLNWTAQTSVLGGVNNWLAASPNSGVSNTAASSAAPVVTVSVNPNGLSPGVYYGLVTVIAPGAANTPQGVVAILQILPAGTDVAPVVQPTSLTFTGAGGGSSPGSQNVQVYDPTGTNKSFRSEIVTADGGSWPVTLPTDATIPSNGPVPVVVQPTVNSLEPGTYQSTLSLQFSDGRVSTVGIQFVVTAGGSASANAISAVRRPAQASGPCVSNRLMPSLVTLGSGFSVPAGYPQGLEALVFDNCGAPQVDGTVFVQFSNGDSPVKLQSLGNGLWDGTWPVGSMPTSVTLTVAAQNAATIKGQSVINGGLATAMPSPMIPSNGVVSTASFAAGQPVAPGELISIFGSQLSGGQLPADAGTLPPVLAGTQVAIGSQTGPSAGTFQALPLYYASTGLVNAVVPYETSVNTNQQILLQWGAAYAPPVYVDVAAAAPGIFVVADLSGNAIGPNNPAKAGQTVVIYCAGLGAVSPPVADGVGTTTLSYAQNSVIVMIGGQTISNPIFTGLTPGVAGLYQINIAVPSAIAPSDSVPVSIVVAGQPSVQVVTSVH